MARIFEVPGYGYYFAAGENGDAARLNFFLADAAEVAAEAAAGNVPVIIASGSPTRGAHPCDEPCPVRIVDEHYVQRRMADQPGYRIPPGFTACVVVAGSSAPMLKGVAQRAVEALIAVFPAGFSQDDLNDAARAGDARNALKDLAAKDPLWRAAIRFPRSGSGSKENHGYRIGTYTEVVEAMAELVEAGILTPDALRRALHECGPDAPPAHLEHLLNRVLAEDLGQRARG